MLREQLDAAGAWLRCLLWLAGLGLFVQMAGHVFNSDGSRHATQIYLLLMLPALLLLIGLRGAIPLWRQPPAAFMLLLVVWVLLIMGGHPGSVKGLGYGVPVVLFLLLYVFALACLGEHEERFSMIAVAAVLVVGGGAWFSLYYQFFEMGRISQPYKVLRWLRMHESGWRGFADFSHPIIAGLYHGFFSILATWLFLRSRTRPWQVVLYLFCMAGLVLYVALTFSRGAWFALLASGLLLLLLFPGSKSRVLLVFGAAVLFLAIYLFWPEIQRERTIGVNGRDLIWLDWFNRLPEFWLLGSGAAAEFGFTFPNGQRYLYAHSYYLQIWYEYGIVGFLLFVALLASLSWKGWGCREQPLAKLGLALLVFVMVAMVSEVHSIFLKPSVYWMLFWFPVGILLAVRPARAKTVG